jgi:hypothetical protein
MSRLVHGSAARHMPFQALQQDLNKPYAYLIECTCGRPLGSLGQYKPDLAGRRIMSCDDATPEQNAELLRRMKLVLTPQFLRTTKGCGAITIVGPTGQILKVFDKRDPQHQALREKLDILRINAQRRLGQQGP